MEGTRRENRKFSSCRTKGKGEIFKTGGPMM